MPYGNKPKSIGLKKLAEATPDLNYVGPAKYAPKSKCTGGGPHMYSKGKNDINTPMIFSERAKKVMGKCSALMPKMYGKPKAAGDNIIKDKKTGEARKTTAREKVVAVDKSLMKQLEKKLGRKPTVAEYNRALGK